MTDEYKFKLSFLTLKNARTLFVFGLARLGTWLPRQFTLRVGDFLGEQFYKRNRKRREIVDVNLSLCFPELTETERKAMALQHFRCYGRSIIDMGLVWWGSDKKLNRLVKFEGLEEVQDLISQGHQVIFLAPHVVSIDIAGVYLSSRVFLASMMKRAKDPLVNWLLLYGRHRFGGVMVMRDDGIRALIRKMREKRNIYLVPDEDFGPDSSHFVPFFGVERSTLSVVGRLARITRAKVVSMATTMDVENGTYTIHLKPETDDFPTGDEIADTRRVSEILERCIRLAPEQYMWTFRWFKTRPEGESSPYPDF